MDIDQFAQFQIDFEEIPNPFDVSEEEDPRSPKTSQILDDQTVTQETISDQDPTPQELDLKKYPNISIQSIITLLYTKLVASKTQKDQKEYLIVAPIKWAGTRKNWYYEQKLAYFKGYPRMKSQNPNIEQLTHLLLTSVDKNNLLKRVTAKCFMEFGVCYEDVVKQIKILQYPIRAQRRKYNRMVGEVVTSAFRELQKFIISHFEPNIKPSTAKDIEILHPILLNPLKYLTMQEQRIFHDFIKINYDSDSAGTLVEKQKAYHLYKKIYKCKANIKTIGIIDQQLRRNYLRDNEQYLPCPSEAVVRMQNGSVIWSRQMEYHLLYFYVQEGKISKAKKAMRRRYNNTDAFADLLVVRRRFYKMMRQSVRILQRYVSDLGQKVKAKLELEEQQTKMLISAPQSYNVRVYLSYLYRYQNHQPKFIEKAVVQVNDFLQEKARNRFEQMQGKGILRM